MKTITCVGGFIPNKKGLYLFGKRSKKKTWAPNLWDIPGGKSLRNENPLLTLRRELMEEVGIEVRDARLIETVEMPDEDENLIIYHIYLVTAYRGKVANLSDEHSELRWFTAKDINSKKLALEGYKELIAGMNVAGY